MIGDSITLHGTLSDYDAALVNEGGYSAEYRAKDGTTMYSLLIRHSKEKVAKGEVAMDRHNVQVTATFAPTTAFPNGHTAQAYIVLRLPPAADAAEAIDLVGMIVGVLKGPLDDYATVGQILNWES